MAIPTTYPNGTVTFDVIADDGVGGRMEFDLSETFVTLIDGQDTVIATIGPSAGVAVVSGDAGAYQVENWPLGGTAGTGDLTANWYAVGTDAATVSPQPYTESIYTIVTSPSNGYCDLSDLPKYGLEGATNYYASEDDGNSYIEQSFNWLNRRLEAILPDVDVPVATNSAGVYDEHLIGVNALMTNYYLASRRHRGEWSEEPPWITAFKDDAEQTLDAIGSRNIILEEQTSGVESGIGPVTPYATNTGLSVFHSDRFGYNGPYTDSQYPRTFVIEIDAVGADSDIDDSTFKWSSDGVTWDSTGVSCGTAWQELMQNAHIRWARVGGTVNQVALGDRYTFVCTPLSKAVAGQPNAGRTVRMWRG
ncbi:MAG: hypothetical protein KOO60_11000 [Gemmatimonadales bacterium]|nr:hypothetical protein [Gemmatimonadales bacterium]